MLKEINRIRYLVSITYAILIYFFGISVRTFSQGLSVYSFLQSFVYDNLFLGFLLLVSYVIFRQRLQFGYATLLAIMVFSTAAGFAFYYANNFILPNILAFVIPRPSQRYPPVAIIIYFGMFTFIWATSHLWMQTLYAFHNREMELVRKQADAERGALFSELRRQRQQLDPHFVFNCLNAIAAEIHDKPKRALTLVRELGAFLRFSLDTADRPLVPLAMEVSAMRSFLRVQNLRFGSRLATSFSIDPSSRKRLIPALLLLPLVDNAVKYGFADETGVLTISITVKTQQDELWIEIRNTGSTAEQHLQVPSTHTGLNNLKNRLVLHYPDRHSFSLEQEDRDVVAKLVVRGAPCLER